MLFRKYVLPTPCRWLVEYGFVLGDGRAERHCHAWNVTAKDVAASRTSGTVPTSASISAAEVRLSQAGLPPWIWARLDGSGTVHTSLVEWLSVALGPGPAANAENEAPKGVDKQEAWALRALCRMVKQQQSLLEATVQRSSEALLRLVTKGGAGSSISEHQSSLLELAKGGVTASAASAARLAQFC